MLSTSLDNLLDMTLESVLTDAMSLSPRDRALLADELWRSVPPDERSLQLTPAQREDLKRRLAEDAAGYSDPQPWAHARAEILPKSGHASEPASGHDHRPGT